MNKWNYDLGTVGKNLREAIHTEIESIASCAWTLENLLKCLDYIREICPVAINDIFETRREGIQESFEEMSALDEEEYPYAEDVVNEWLDTFYDLCDFYRIWIGV